MKSGLYACAGASATASAAACAKRFDDPITNESNVYFRLKPPLSGLLGGMRATIGAAAGSSKPSSVTGSAGAKPSSETRSSIGRSSPVTSRMAAPIRPRKWPSIQSRVKSLGTARTKQSLSSRPRASLNHVPYVVSLSAPLSRPATSLHKASAVSSIWCSTPPPAPPPREHGSGEHTNLPNHCKTGNFAGPFRRHTLPPQLWITVGETPSFRIAVRNSAVDKPVDGRRLYCAARSPPFGGIFIFRPFSPHEAHLSAERSPPEAQARLPGAHVDPG